MNLKIMKTKHNNKWSKMIRLKIINDFMIYRISKKIFNNLKKFYKAVKYLKKFLQKLGKYNRP